MLLLATAGCAAPDGRGDAPEALRQALELTRQAHLHTDAALLASQLADTLISVDAGQITSQPRVEVERMFRTYFAGARYAAWEDVTPPLIRATPDGHMAWVIRKVRVDREEPAPGGGTRRRLFVCAYTATYENRSGKWRMTTVTSTFEPPPADTVNSDASPRSSTGRAPRR